MGIFVIVFCLNLRYLAIALSHVHLATLLTVSLAPVHSTVTDPLNCMLNITLSLIHKTVCLTLKRMKVLGEHALLCLKYHRYTFTSILTSVATRTVTRKGVNYTYLPILYREV